MEKRIEDLKETAPCGMLIHYTVNEEDRRSDRRDQKRGRSDLRQESEEHDIDDQNWAEM